MSKRHFKQIFDRRRFIKLYGPGAGALLLQSGCRSKINQIKLPGVLGFEMSPFDLKNM